jgi:hypothetical protein
MIVNFRAREISRGVHKLIQTPTSIKKKMLSMNIISIYIVKEYVK